jgi:hypothetical protein
MASGVVRVEQYVPRLRAHGVRCLVFNYFAPGARARRRWTDGPSRVRNPALRRAARLLLDMWTPPTSGRSA